ncbi:MAG: rod shape-determining protein MreC [Mediterranea massiliensis]|nr:rod shape-determining protein MreC [Mediterranea massiliensis]
MRNLLNFLIKYNYWLVFLLLQAISLLLLFRFNNYQQSVFFTSANALIGKIYKTTGGISAYFNLKEANDALLDRNVWLEQRVALLEKTLNDRNQDSVKLYSLYRVMEHYPAPIKASVVKNSLTKLDNYITLDVGRKDGISPDMAVVDARGVVGIVYKTSDHYSLVIPILNSKSSISCKIVGSDYFGHLKWEGGDTRTAWLKDLPRHAEFSIGDTVVTSGYSAVFPEGIMVGIIDEIADSHDGLTYLLKVRLATNFGSLHNVRILNRQGRQEQKDLEKDIKEN